jgi:hypothetical protein
MFTCTCILPIIRVPDNYNKFIFCRHELVYTKYDIVAGSSDVSHSVQGLEPGVEYLFVVTATNQAGEGETSNSRSAKTFNAGLWIPPPLHFVNQSAFSHLKLVMDGLMLCNI